MSSKTYFLPMVPEPLDLGLFDTAPWDEAQKTLRELAHEWCPVCKRSIKESEIHMVAEGVCHRITGLAIAPLPTSW